MMLLLYWLYLEFISWDDELKTSHRYKLVRCNGIITSSRNG